jgi:8-oxo-dGTP pyrophosphatase MutT (NUDIX family)
MVQMYKIFVNKKQIYLINNPAKIDILKDASKYVLLNYQEYKDIQLLIDNFVLNKENTNNIIIFDKNVEKLKEDFFVHFNAIEAAGGIVLNQQDEILLIYRRGSWDLPKGKIDDGESIEDAAIREIEEETGISHLRIIDKINIKETQQNITYHYYENDRLKCIKITHWFILKTNKIQIPIPQSEEDIEKAIWVNKSELHNFFDNMYGSIQDVLNSIL